MKYFTKKSFSVFNGAPSNTNFTLLANYTDALILSNNGIVHFKVFKNTRDRSVSFNVS